MIYPPQIFDKTHVLSKLRNLNLPTTLLFNAFELCNSDKMRRVLRNARGEEISFRPSLTHPEKFIGQIFYFLI